MSESAITTKWKRGAAAGAGFALIATLVATTTGPASLSASSHREAPLIAGDPRADNTDVYAFVSPDDEDSVTLIANWIPFEEPSGGPNFYPWGDGTVDDPGTAENEDEGYRYLIHIDNDGDAVADLTYEWLFKTIIKNDDTFIYNTGPFTSVEDETLNYYQRYDLNVIDGDGNRTNIGSDIIAAPSIAGEASTPDYTPLVAEAVESGTFGDLKSFAGQADDSFFLDLRVFDLLYGGDLSKNDEDTLAGYNVNTIALQVPKTELAINGDVANNPVIGVWSTTDRAVTRDDGSGNAVTDFTQVSRLGNPLVNEVVIPLKIKDAFNSIPPSADADVPEAVEAVRNPILPPLVEAVYGIPEREGDRTDLAEIFLQGISEANTGLFSDDPNQNPALNVDLNSLGLNQDSVAEIRPSEMLRLNMAVPVTANPQPLGVLQGDIQGFPNGRRLTDDVTNAAILVAEGAVFGPDPLEPQFATLLQNQADQVDRNDLDFKDEFPYVANPHLDSVNVGSIEGQNTPRNPSIISINPERILDTRDSTKPAAGSTTVVNVGGALVPADAQAAFLNITAARAEALGFVTAFPCDADGDGNQDDRPVASSLNPDPTRIVSGLVSVAADANGDVCIYTETAADLIVDVQAYIPAMAEYTTIQPNRLLDTRNGAKPAAGSVQTIDVGDVAAGSKAVLLNLTSVQTEGTGFLTAYPCDAERPTASNLNPVSDTRRANLASVKVSAAGTVCVFTSNSTHLAVDIVGAFPAASAYEAIVPERLVDTRPGAEQTGYSGSKPIAGQVIEIDVRGPGTNVPDDAGTVFLNVTGVAPEGDPGYLTVFPCGEDRPGASNVNLRDLNTATAAVAKVGDNDRVCVYTFQPAHIVVDLVGFFPGTVIPS